MCVYVAYIHTYGKMKDASFFKIHATFVYFPSMRAHVFHCCSEESVARRNLRRTIALRTNEGKLAMSIPAPPRANRRKYSLAGEMSGARTAINSRYIHLFIIFFMKTQLCESLKFRCLARSCKNVQIHIPDTQNSHFRLRRFMSL